MIIFFYSSKANSQSYIKGVILSDSNQILEKASVSYLATGQITLSDSLGEFKIKYVKSSLNLLVVTFAGYKSDTVYIPRLYDNEFYQIKIVLENNSYVIGSYISNAVRKKEPGIVIPIKPLATTPSVSGDFNDYIKTLQGVSSNNELSSQYNVRGGSYDENLIYVNNIEIYRPQLIRSGQQEGLSFINSDLVNNVNFSAGGFEAKYGDKLSSVLDVSYRTPKKFEAGAQIGMLGASFYFEGVKNKYDSFRRREVPKFTYLVGARYRGNKNVLNSLDAIGLYKSRFSDFQSLLSYHINRLNRIEWITNLAQNRFRFEPELQETTFGTIQSALKLRIGFDGQEIMDYNSAMTGLSYIFDDKITELKFMVSGFVSQEKEHYDIQGAYEIFELDNNLGSSGFGDTKSLLGIGYFINHARNDLKFTVLNVAHQGQRLLRNRNKSKNTSRLLWGLKFQTESIKDKFKEWKYNDSSGYNINPFGQSGTVLSLSEFINSKTQINNQRSSGFVQYQKGFGSKNQANLTLGCRAIYSSLNQETNVSPRVQFYYDPNRLYNSKVKVDSLMKRNTLYKAAFGYYYQPPFYREMRDFNGNINTNLKAQRSIHGVIGNELVFKKWNRPFKLASEIYYKYLDYMVPYVLDNVRIRYYANNSAQGYATGFDMRLNGEFIKDLESWFTLSLLKTNETIKYIKDGVEITSPSLRRPTDRRVSASIMFQDELKKNPDFRMHLMMHFGSGLPYYLGGDARYKKGNTLPAYSRVDIGFSKVLIGGVKDKMKESLNLKKRNHIKNLWIGVDVFNLLQINNVISYVWVKDFANNTYGVPNYLTGRRLNIKIAGNF